MKYSFWHLALYISVISISSPSLAALTDYRTATWNMQGSSAATESKWNVNIRQLVSGDGAVQILAVQEAGSVPRTANNTGRIIPSPPGTNFQIREFEWNLGTRSRPENRWIYFLEWDINARRVNIALVADRPADDIVSFGNPLNGTCRPTMGIGFNRTGGRGRDYFFSLHAFSGGGNDAAPAIRCIHDHFTTSGDRDSQWLVMGDYNQNPSILQSRLDLLPTPVAQNVSIVTQTAPTQASGGTLDYAVAGQVGSSQTLAQALAAAMFIAQLHGQITSDHVPVKFYRK